MTLPIKRGAAIPADHRYVMHAAIKAHEPDMTRRLWAFAPIRGKQQGDLLELKDWSTLKLRVPEADIGSVVAFSEKTHTIGGHLVEFGEPKLLHPLPRPPVLRADMVLVTGDRAPHGHRDVWFGDAIGRRLGAMLGRYDFGVYYGERRHMQIHQTRLWGQEVAVKGLTEEESLRLQLEGLGQKRAMGCGFFAPDE